ncbi:MAG: chorismate synthase [Acidobacteriota bacterium]
MRFLTSGDSHGASITAIVEGVPAGLPIEKEYIKKELLRRNKCAGRSQRMALEKEEVIILSGVRKGLSTGAPITIMIPNSEFYDLSEAQILQIQNDLPVARPGHADLNGMLKFGFKEARNVAERASARETAARVAIGAIAKMFLKEFNISFASAIIQVGEIKSSKKITFEKASKLDAYFPFSDKNRTKAVLNLLENFKERGETVGGKVWASAKGVVPGIGSYTNWDKRLDAQIAYHLMSIPSVKGVLIGDIENAVSLKGSAAQDQFADSSKIFYKRKTNLAGGIEGGVSNGEDIVATCFVKPIPSSKFSKKGLNLQTKKKQAPQITRADTTSLAPVAVICESLMAIVIMQNYLEKFGADSVDDIKNSFSIYQKRLRK